MNASQDNSPKLNTNANNSNTRSLGNQSIEASTFRGKSDPAWEYFGFKKDEEELMYTLAFIVQ